MNIKRHNLQLSVAEAILVCSQTTSSTIGLKKNLDATTYYRQNWIKEIVENFFNQALFTNASYTLERTTLLPIVNKKAFYMAEAIPVCSRTTSWTNNLGVKRNLNTTTYYRQNRTQEN